mgnify:CR=1 FL=1
MARHGASAPRRQCGVGRREPLGGATGAYFMERGPRKTEFCGEGKCASGGCGIRNFSKKIEKSPAERGFFDIFQ